MLKLFYPLFRFLILLVAVVVLGIQLYVWYNNGYFNDIRFYTIMYVLFWDITFLCGSYFLAWEIFPKRDMKKRHKFLCTFYGFKQDSVYVCTRNYSNIGSFIKSRLLTGKYYFFKLIVLE